MSQLTEIKPRKIAHKIGNANTNAIRCKIVRSRGSSPIIDEIRELSINPKYSVC